MNADDKQPEDLKHIFLDGFSLFKKTYLHVSPLTIFLAVIIFAPSLFIFNPDKPFLFVGYFIFSIFVFSSVIYYAAHVKRGEQVSLIRSVLIATEKLIIILLTAIFVMILTSIGYCFLIIPGIIVTVWFSMCLPLILLEHAGPFSALQESYELTTDDWSRTAVVVFLPLVITGFLGFVFAEIFMFFQLSTLYYEILLAVFILFASLIYLPWVAALLVAQFEDLKKRKSLRDARAQLAGLDQAQKSTS